MLIALTQYLTILERTMLLSSIRSNIELVFKAKASQLDECAGWGQILLGWLSSSSCRSRKDFDSLWWKAGGIEDSCTCGQCDELQEGMYTTLHREFSVVFREDLFE